MNVVSEQLEQLEKWIEENPLKNFILNAPSGINRNQIAVLVGVSRQTLNQWEKGIVTPNDKNFESLAKLTNDPMIKENWLAWLGQKPQL